MLLPLVLALALQQEPAPAAPAAPAPAITESLFVVKPFAERLALKFNWRIVQIREESIAFPTGLVRDVTSALSSRASADPVRRAAALTALGATGLAGGRQLLVEGARTGGPLEKRAAVLALAELGPESVTFLRQTAESTDPFLAEVGLLGLLRMGSPAVQAEVQAVADDPTSQLAPVAAGLLAFLADPGGPAPAPPSVKLLYELRWEAAMKFGLVNGRRYSQLQIDRLWDDPAFVGTVVLRSARKLSLPGVRDHLLAMVDKVGGPEVVHAAVSRIPLALGSLIQLGIWQPANLEEWDAALDALVETRTPKEGYEIARAAFEVEQLRARAVGILMAMGDETRTGELKDLLFSDDLEQRILLTRSLGSSRDPSWIAELGKLRSESDDRLSSAALVAQMRMRYRPAEEVVRSTVLDGEHADRRSVVLELLEVHRDSRVPPLLSAALPHLEGALRLRVAGVLCSGTSSTPRLIVRDALERGVESDLGPELVRALSISADHEDLEFLSSLFPTGRREQDIELARALVEHDHPVGLSLLEQALWSSDFDQSVIAAGLIVVSRGIDTLALHLDSPPGPVGRGDRRRVGFALGEWGGFEALEVLSRRRPSSDPALQGAYLGAMTARTQ